MTIIRPARPRLYQGESRARRLFFRVLSWVLFAGVVFARPMLGLALTAVTVFLNMKRERNAEFFIERP